MVNKFTPILKEGKFFEFMNFGVGLQSGGFRPCKNSFNIHFLYSTFVREVDGSSIDVHGFQFSPFDMILSKSVDDVLRFTKHSGMDLPFGGKVVVFGGDFRQILPVIAIQ